MADFKHFSVVAGGDTVEGHQVPDGVVGPSVMSAKIWADSVEQAVDVAPRFEPGGNPQTVREGLRQLDLVAGRRLATRFETGRSLQREHDELSAGLDIGQRGVFQTLPARRALNEDEPGNDGQHRLRH